MANISLNVGATSVNASLMTPTNIKDGSVTTDKLADGAVSSAKLADGSVTTEKLNAAVRGQISDLKSAIDEDETLLEKETTTGVNKWNPAEAVTNTVVSNAVKSLGELSSENGYTTSGFIAVQSGDVVRWDYSANAVSEGDTLARGTNVFRIAEYDQNKSCLLVSANWAGLPYTVQNQNTAFVRLSVPTRTTNSVITGNSSTSQINYTPYQSSVDFKRISDIENTLDEFAQDMANVESAVDDSERVLSMMVSKNKIDMATITKNAAINNVPTSPNYGKLYTENGYSTTDFIPISKGDFVRMYRSASANPVEGSTLFGNDDTAFRIAEYNSAREIIYCSANWVSLPYTVRTDGAAFIRITTANANFYMLFVNEESSVQPYYTAYRPEWAAITDLEKVFNPAEVITPSALYGVTGQQINIYKANLVAGNRLKSLAYIHTTMPDNAIQSDERTIWNPAGTALAEATKNWEVFKYGLENQPEIKPIKVCNVPKATGSASIKVLVIGDSKIAGGYVTYHFLHSFDDDDMSCTLLGTQYSWTPDNRHEGYGSRTAQWMCTNASSPFCNNGAFDFAHYLSANSIDTPDYVFINLGTNDASQLSSGYAENFVTYITQMVNGIHSVSSSIKVIVGLCEGVCTTQDTNNAGFLNWDINRKISILHKAAIAAFDNRASENIYVCPMYMGMDLTQDYRMNEVPLSQRDADVNNGDGDGKTRMQIVDPIHQSEVGYWKNADYMYALVKYITAKALT